MKGGTVKFQESKESPEPLEELFNSIRRGINGENQLYLECEIKSVCCVTVIVFPKIGPNNWAQRLITRFSIRNRWKFKLFSCSRQ